jgi:hypothetical protein
MDDGSGPIITDSSIYNDGGILYPTPAGPDWTRGVVGDGLSFDGNSDYIDLGNPSNLAITGAITIEAWVLRSGPPGSYPSQHAYNNIVAKGGIWTSNSAYVFGIRHTNDASYNGLYLSWKNGGTTYGVQTWTGYDPFDDGQWHHIAGVRDANYDIRLYIDGQLSATDTDNIAPIDGGQNVFIGRGTHGNWNEGNFNGKLDEVAIWEKALSPDEILLHYTNGLIGEDYLYIPPDLAIQNLFEDIQDEGLPEGSENSLLAKLDAALESLENGEDQEAMNILNAFKNAVEAQRGKKLSDAQATALIEATDDILDTI